MSLCNKTFDGRSAVPRRKIRGVQPSHLAVFRAIDRCSSQHLRDCRHRLASETGQDIPRSGAVGDQDLGRRYSREACVGAMLALACSCNELTEVTYERRPCM